MNSFIYDINMEVVSFSKGISFPKCIHLYRPAFGKSFLFSATHEWDCLRGRRAEIQSVAAPAECVATTRTKGN